MTFKQRLKQAIGNRKLERREYKMDVNVYILTTPTWINHLGIGRRRKGKAENKQAACGNSEESSIFTSYPVFQLGTNLICSSMSRGRTKTLLYQTPTLLAPT